YEALYNEVKNNEKREIQDDFTGLSIEPGKVSLSSLNTHSLVELRYEYGSVFGTLRTSLDRQFSVVFSDGYLDGQSDPPKWIRGKVFLVEKDNLLWIKEIERPTNAAVSDNGTVALLYSLYRDSAASLSSKEFLDLGGTLAVIEKSGKTLFTYDFGSNIEGCAITRDGDLVSVGTLYPDNSVYCFYVGEKKELSSKHKDYNRKNAVTGLEVRGKGLLWKYKSHGRRKPILGLEFRGNQIAVFTGKNLATMEKEYVLNLDGTLTVEYQKKLETLKKIKKLRPQEKVASLLALAISGDKQDAIEGLFELISFAKTKGSIPHYVSIITTLRSCLESVEDDVFDLIWKVMRQILRRKPQALNPIMPDFISRLNKTAQNDVIHTLMILSELGGVNPSWIKAEKQFIEQKLRSKFWNERRYAVFAIGSIGSMEPSFVEDLIPTLIEYASDSEKVKIELEEIAMRDHDVTASDILIGINMLRDACIDSLGMIGKRSPESVNAAIPLLEKLSKDASSPSYTMNKAIRAFNAIKGIN
ncbi:MAG: HEAT repeat domain-containing protein, partial [Thermoproteota archaeon]|nr:HEAT repeat domain-containing protein [Thermoproteota archaeon]